MKTHNPIKPGMFACLLLPITLCLTVNQAYAQDRRDDQRPPRDEHVGEKLETLTAEQLKQVKAILSRYDAGALTAEQARSIHESFRQAGIHGGPAINDAVKATGFDPDKLRDLSAPPETPTGRGERNPLGREEGNRSQDSNDRQPTDRDANKQEQYSITQAISDEAQLHTIAFSGLAFITGDFGAATFVPPGKVCDFFGFQYMRDIDAAHKGHNPMFLDRVAGNVLHILTDEQRALFAKSARMEAVQLRLLAEKRLPLIKAFCRELAGDIPSGSKGLNQSSVAQYVGEIFAFDAEVSYRRAEVFGKVASSFTSGQKEYLAKMKFGDFNTWPAVDMDKYKLPRGTEKLVNVAYMTYASEFFSWYAGSVEADIYFCPERHGTYFGGFYMKDMPAMGKRDYDISTSVTGDSGKEFLNILTQEQRTNILAIPDLQRKALKEIVDIRRDMSTELRKFLKGEKVDKEKVLTLGRRYGEADGEMSYYYATAFAKVGRTLSAEQRKALVKLRNLDGYTSAPAYIYSDPVQGGIKLPDTDHFFFPPKANGVRTK